MAAGYLGAMLRRILITFALVLAACGGGGATTTTTGDGGGALPPGSTAIRVSSDLGVGEERLLIAIAGPAGERLAAPDLPVTLEVYPEGEPEEGQTVPGTFMWAVPEVSGMYRADVEFDRAGVWMVVVTPEDGAPLDPVAVGVAEDTLTPAVGTAAPASDTFIAADVADLAEITTDPEPDPRFYQVSVADAVASGDPTVVVFATPRFCQTAVCGPTLDGVKEIAASYPNVNWVHVEVFTNLDDPDALAVVPAAVEWGLPTEPWVFVVDGDGVVRGRFEGVVSREELIGLLDALV